MSNTPRFEKANDTNDDAECSFCGRKRSEVQAMFRSDNARICNLCIGKLKQDDTQVH